MTLSTLNMSIYSNVTEQDLINLPKLAEQLKNQSYLKIKIRILKQTHDIKLAESLSPITKKLNIIIDSIKKTGGVIKELKSADNIKAQPKSPTFSNSMQEMIGSLMNSRSSLKITQYESGRANSLGVPNQLSEADTIKKVKVSLIELQKHISFIIKIIHWWDYEKWRWYLNDV